jgi:hypothetical protein
MRTIALTISALLSSVCVAQSNQVIERSLTADAKREHRLIDGQKVVLQLSRQGVLSRKPSERRDYSSFYVPQQTVVVLGAKLVSFEHEYQGRYIGCCVNPGNAVILQPIDGTDEIETFARRNGCKYSVGNEILYVPEMVGKALSKPDRDSLVEVSCKDNYLFDEQGRTP